MAAAHIQIFCTEQSFAIHIHLQGIFNVLNTAHIGAKGDSFSIPGDCRLAAQLFQPMSLPEICFLFYPERGQNFVIRINDNHAFFRIHTNHHSIFQFA